MVTLPVARWGAMQVVLLGRASSPVLWPGGTGGGLGLAVRGGGGGSVAGGCEGSCATWSLPWQPATRKAKDTNILVVCLACGIVGFP